MSAPEATPNGAGDVRDPSGFLSEIIGAPVTVKLNSGVVYKGLQASELIKVGTLTKARGQGSYSLLMAT